MESDYSLQEKNRFSTFLIFAVLLTVILNIGFSINSSHFRVKTIEIESISNNYDSTDFSNEVLNQSIWLINSDTFISKKMQYPTIENVEVLKDYPDKVILVISEHAELIVISDLRGTIPVRDVLYKNGLKIPSPEVSDLPTIVITNGPVEAGFNGELISLIMTLKNYNLDLSNLSFSYDGERFKGAYRETLIDFGPPVDLGTKAAALGALLEKSECSGDVRFLGTEELIANC
tara:strand:+ start:837 stop:1532 length:696 start_codon:yes stop_codon:yes gene_type:complete